MTQLRLWFWQLRVAYLNACLDRMPAYDPYTIDTILARDAAIRKISNLQRQLGVRE